MPIDKFGRSDKKREKTSPIAGAGFFHVQDGNYDVRSRRLTNIAPPINDNDCVTKGFLTNSLSTLKVNDEILTTLKKFENQISRLESQWQGHMDQQPFHISRDGDLFLNYINRTLKNGATFRHKMIVKNIGEPIDDDDAAHKKFVSDAIERRFSSIPFVITKEGDIKFTPTKIKNADGSLTERKRRLIGVEWSK